MRDLTVQIRCPGCGRTLQVKVRDMVPGRVRHCGCGCVIRFDGDDGRKVQREIDQMERELKKLSRTISFRL